MNKIKINTKIEIDEFFFYEITIVALHLPDLCIAGINLKD